jgi:restriction system protein
MKRVLKQFPEFIEFLNSSGKVTATVAEQVVLESGATPLETLEASYQNLRKQLAVELLDRVKSSKPSFFEQLVVDLLVAMGYGGSQKDAGKAVGKSGDGGIDGIIKEDKLGLDVVYIQAKRWENTVGIETVQNFAGSLEGHRVRKGVLITTSNFSQPAKNYVNKIEKKIVLIDGEQLAQYMLEFNVGVNTVETYVIKKIDSDYFEEEQ